MAKELDKTLTEIFDEFNATMEVKFNKIDASLAKLKAALKGEKVED
jgi:hypothetical protein